MYQSCLQPTLEQLLDDPLVRLVMRADGVRPEALREVLAVLAARAAPSRDDPAPAAPVR